MKKNILFFFFFAVFSFSVHALRFDILGGLSYKNTSYNGKTSLNGSTVDLDANSGSMGVNIGLDLFFTDFVGLYTRLGFYSVDSFNRKVDGHKLDYKNSNSIDYSMTYDLGVSFAKPINDYFSICIAPALSMNYIDTAHNDFKNQYRATVDNYLCYGLSADIYMKFKYKHFVSALGCSGSYLPFCLMTSKDSAIDYSFNIKNSSAYSIRPYISAGVSF